MVRDQEFAAWLKEWLVWEEFLKSLTALNHANCQDSYECIFHIAFYR